MSGGDERRVEVRRSARRKKTVQAYRDGDTTVVLIPAHLSAAEEERQVRRLVERLDRRERRRVLSDDDLLVRAYALSDRWLRGEARPVSVRWVGNQNSRWGSCTAADGSIRLSDRLVGMPDHVIDFVLLHELAHLIEPNHSPAFHRLLRDFPHLERAQGFLEGVVWRPR